MSLASPRHVEVYESGFDSSGADTVYAPLTLYNTDDTPPTANTTPVGTIYVQYTA